MPKRKPSQRRHPEKTPQQPRDRLAEIREDWFDYRLEKDHAFLKRIEVARRQIRGGEGVRIEDVED